MDFFCLVFITFLFIVFIAFLFADSDFTLFFYHRFYQDRASLKNKVVWLTGASSGIGKSLAYELADAGCRLVLSARRENLLEQVKEECLQKSHLKSEDILILPMDVTDYDSMPKLASKVLEHFKQIDILINNAGRGQRAEWMKTDLSVDRNLWEINVLGPVALTKVVLPYMKEAKKGQIVLSGSIAGKLPVPMSGSYAGTKYALLGYFNSLRVEVMDLNISVTHACIGPVFSDILSASVSETLEHPANWQKEGFMPDKMATDRCAALMVTSMVNELTEVWIAKQPFLLLTFLSQYFPSITNFIFTGKLVRIIMLIRRGHTITGAFREVFSIN